jgi:hypothetical protein
MSRQKLKEVQAQLARLRPLLDPRGRLRTETHPRTRRLMYEEIARALSELEAELRRVA